MTSPGTDGPPDDVRGGVTTPAAAPVWWDRRTPVEQTAVWRATAWPPPPPPPPPAHTATAPTVGGAGARPLPGPPTLPPASPVRPDGPSWGLPDVLISFVMFLLVPSMFGVGAVLAGVITVEELEDPSAWVTVAMVVATWVGFAIWPLVIMRWKGTGSLRGDFGLEFRPKDILWAVGGIVVFLGVSLVASVLYSLASGGDQPPSNADIVDADAASTAALVALFLAVAVGTPIVEEIWFRGFLLRAVGKKWGAPIGLVLSSVIFGALHVRGEGLGDLWIIALLIVYGGILGFIDLRNDGRLGPSIICHALNNGATLLIVTM